jgi:hypothetical protein
MENQMSKPSYNTRDKRWYVMWGAVRYTFQSQSKAEDFYSKHKDEV